MANGYQPGAQLAGLLNALVPSVMKMGGYRPPNPPQPVRRAPVASLTPSQRALIQFQHAHLPTASANNQHGSRAFLNDKPGFAERVARGALKYSGATDLAKGAKWSATHPLAKLEGRGRASQQTMSFPGSGRLKVPGVAEGTGARVVLHSKAHANALYFHDGDLHAALSSMEQLPKAGAKLKRGHVYYAGDAMSHIARQGADSRMPIVQNLKHGWVVIGPKGSHHGDVAETVSRATGEKHWVSDMQGHEAYGHDPHIAVRDIPPFINWDLPGSALPHGSLSHVGDSPEAVMGRMNLIHQLAKAGAHGDTKVHKGYNGPFKEPPVSMARKPKPTNLTPSDIQKRFTERRGHTRASDWLDFDPNKWNKR